MSVFKFSASFNFSMVHLLLQIAVALAFAVTQLALLIESLILYQFSRVGILTSSYPLGCSSVFLATLSVLKKFSM